MLSTTKRAMMKIGTHSGTFHCDEALGCWMLKNTLKFKDADIVRTRDPDVLKDMDIVLDVGAVYSPETNRFDHHQRGFAECFGNGFTTKLSSAGLVYKHYGREVVANILGIEADDPSVDVIYQQVYKTFVEAVDAIDNGIPQYDTANPPQYVNNTGLSARIGRLNPKWSEPYTDDVLYQRFLKAMNTAGEEFKEAVEYVGRYWLPARQIVQQGLEERFNVDESGQIVKLQGCPWKEHLYDLEADMKIEKPILFVLLEDDRDKSWRVQAVSKCLGSFENRQSLRSEWCGVRDQELSSLSGIPGCIFVHANGFIGGNKTYEGALRMAQLSLP